MQEFNIPNNEPLFLKSGDELLTLAQRSLHKGDLESAIDLYLEAKEKRTDNYILLTHLGMAFYKTGSLSYAIMCIDDALKLAGDNPMVLSNAGLIYLNEKMPEKAFPFFQRVYAQFPENSKIEYNRNLALEIINYKKNPEKLEEKIQTMFDDTQNMVSNAEIIAENLKKPYNNNDTLLKYTEERMEIMQKLFDKYGIEYTIHPAQKQKDSELGSPGKYLLGTMEHFQHKKADASDLCFNISHALFILEEYNMAKQYANRAVQLDEENPYPRTLLKEIERTQPKHNT